jgi:hypothetical protein
VPCRIIPSILIASIGIHKRGVIVKVYAYANNDEELRDFEDGAYGKYYN